MTNLNDYYIRGVTIGMVMNNATKIIVEKEILESEYKPIAEGITLLAIEILENMCEKGLIPKKTKKE